MRTSLAAALPDFPWDSLAEAKQRAAAHPGGICDLSVGTPVDPTPEVARRALTEAADWPGYPTTIGTPQLRAAMVAHLRDRWSVAGLDESGVLPVIGTKELVANLPFQLGVRPGDTVVFPEVAYPTYAVGAALCGATPLACDDPQQVTEAALIWINTPGNPHGRVMSPDLLRAWVTRARELGAILVSDECYGEFGHDVEPISVLDPDVCGDSHEGLLIALSMSKRSNLAGYRAGFLAGDRSLIAELTQVRKHSGFLMPGPVQAAFAAVLADQTHVDAQRERYTRRRAILLPALEAAGFQLAEGDSAAGLYLWVTRGENCRESVAWLAERGILVAPGDFYGSASAEHVRVALTATDERIAAAAERLQG